VQHPSHMGWAPHTVEPTSCERGVVHLLYMWCTRITSRIFLVEKWLIHNSCVHVVHACRHMGWDSWSGSHHMSSSHVSIVVHMLCTTLVQGSLLFLFYFILFYFIILWGIHECGRDEALSRLFMGLFWSFLGSGNSGPYNKLLFGLW